MTIIRKALLKLRQLQNLNKKKYSFLFAISMIISILIALLVDFLLSINFIENTIRLFIALGIGLSLFSLLYILFPAMDDQEFRDQFTIRQRINLSLIIGFVSIVLFLIFVPIGSKLYTVIFGFLIYIFTYLITFCRPSREEYIKFSYGIKDERDLITNRDKNNINNEEKKD